jgi:uncharacterized YigZ family protein
MTEYRMPAGYGTGEYSEKRSRFLGRIWPVETEEEALARIAETRKEYHDARHTCFAYRIRGTGVVRYGDDGEPQGTAGQPMLAVLQGAQLTNVCCTVTRYFGGVLLGTGGLVRAYTAAARAALESAGIRQMARWTALRIDCPYPAFERVKRLIEQDGGVVEGLDYGASVCMDALVRAEAAPRFHAALRELSGGAIAAEERGEQFRGVLLEENA